MKIAYIALGKVNSVNDQGIYFHLLREFVRHGHEVYMITPMEQKYHQPSDLLTEGNFHVLRAKCMNIQKTKNFIEKGLSTITVSYFFYRAIRKLLKGVKFDLIMYVTPPITFASLIKKLKKRDNAPTYLLLKDIFPQNAVDLGMFGENSPIYKYFRHEERKLYQLSDYIGCMSPANMSYLIEHNPDLNVDKIEVNPNTTNAIDYGKPIYGDARAAIRSKYGVPVEKTIYFYGGNLGLPQGLDFLLKVLESNEKRDNSFFLIVGSGTEYPKINNWINGNNPKNTKLIEFMPKDDFDKIIAACDVGLIFLDRRFTIPNYPSRLLDYMQFKMPVICATDKNTDIGPIAQENGYGVWCESGDLESFDRLVDEMNDPVKIKEMGEKSYQYLCDHYSVDKSYEIVMKHFE